MKVDDANLEQKLQKEDLIYVTDEMAGFFRQRLGARFSYYSADGKKIHDKNTIERIEKLAIPPAWRDVWICAKENGYLRATGVDDRRRKQYLYHPDWIKISRENKFSKLTDFALHLPKIRSKIDYHLHQKGQDKSKMLATVVWLLEKTLIRVGNDEYTKENDSFGLTTLRRRHASVRGRDITFRFRGKSGVKNIIEISNPTIARTIKKCIELPGYELFQFFDENGNRHVIDSADVNDFLKEVTHEDFSAKDFRTWGATNLSALNLFRRGSAPDKKTLKHNIVQTVKEVAEHLNNTISVCRNYYIHPTVINSYLAQTLVPHFAKYEHKSVKKGLAWHEHALVRLLQKYK